MKVIVKLRKSGNSTVITIPKEVMENLLWEEGSYVSLETKTRAEEVLRTLIVEQVVLSGEE